MDTEAQAKESAVMLAGMAKEWDIKHGFAEEACHEAGSGWLQGQDSDYTACVQKLILPESYLEPCIVSHSPSSSHAGNMRMTLSKAAEKWIDCWNISSDTSMKSARNWSLSFSDLAEVSQIQAMVLRVFCCRLLSVTHTNG